MTTRGRAHLKTGLALVLGATRVDQLIRFIAGTRNLPLVVGYHRVVDDACARRGSSIAPMLVSRHMFERQLDWIGRRFRFTTLDELGARLESGEPLPTRMAAITFDDGYRDMYEHALPVLQRKGIPAALFVVTDWIDCGEPLVHDRLYLLLTRDWPAAREVLRGLGPVIPAPEFPPTLEDPFRTLRLLLTTCSRDALSRVIDALEETLGFDTSELDGLRPLSWGMLAALRANGVTIGSHTRTHTVLTHEAAARKHDETANSRRALEERLGMPIRHFAYPDGAFDVDTVQAVAEAGYRFGYTTCRHRDRHHPLLTIPRCVLWENSCLDPAGRFSSAVASCVTTGVFDLAAGCRRNHGAGAPEPAMREAS
jgi:peptidoglycan/xylan/chitin deacetylase (PgdA/CDA1 family)